MMRSGDKRAPAGKGPHASKPTPKPGTGATPAATFGRFLGTLARLEGRNGKGGEGGR
jgi:hypothetical protein